jgi:signal transduction histidine kinase
VRSLVLVPIFSGGLLIGGMGFETRNPHKVWKEKDPQLLRTAAEMIGSALERKKAEETLRHALADAEHERDRMDGILRSVADGVIVSDPDGKIVLTNGAAERLLGLSPGRFPGDVARLIAGAKGVDIEVPNSQGTRVLHARTSPLRERGKRGGTVTILRDATREREIERMKTDFVATAAHEFRTPLTSIQGFAEILLQRPDLNEGEKREISTIIYQQTQTLALIVSDLLDVARIESGRGVPIRKERCDLPQLLRQVIARFAPAGCGFRFETAIDPEASEVDVDREKLRQVLENVIGNAVKYSARGGRIGVTGRPVPGGLEICIEDEGIGMRPEQVAKVFDKFYRADVTHGAPQGVGLGMSIVKHIVEAHGGAVRVESVPGRGTRVHIFLPQVAKT